MHPPVCQVADRCFVFPLVFLDCSGPQASAGGDPRGAQAQGLTALPTLAEAQQTDRPRLVSCCNTTRLHQQHHSVTRERERESLLLAAGLAVPPQARPSPLGQTSPFVGRARHNKQQPLVHYVFKILPPSHLTPTSSSAPPDDSSIPPPQSRPSRTRRFRRPPL